MEEEPKNISEQNENFLVQKKKKKWKWKFGRLITKVEKIHHLQKG